MTLPPWRDPLSGAMLAGERVVQKKAKKSEDAVQEGGGGRIEQEPAVLRRARFVGGVGGQGLKSQLLFWLVIRRNPFKINFEETHAEL